GADAPALAGEHRIVSTVDEGDGLSGDDRAIGEDRLVRRLVLPIAAVLVGERQQCAQRTEPRLPAIAGQRGESRPRDADQITVTLRDARLESQTLQVERFTGTQVDRTCNPTLEERGGRILVHVDSREQRGGNILEIQRPAAARAEYFTTVQGRFDL